MRIICCIIVLMMILARPQAQDLTVLRKTVTDMIEQLAEQDGIERDYEELVNNLINLSHHPLNLNATSKAELEQLIFLNDFQIENILFYQYNNGPIVSIYELQAVEGLDQALIEKMEPFVYAGKVMLTPRPFTKIETWGRYQTWLQTPEGYLSTGEALKPVYAGAKNRWLTKAQLNLSERWLAGFTLEKDPGEKAFPHTVPLADFSSGYLQFNGKGKYLRKVVLGDYRLSFGQGLGMWTDMAFSKSSETAQLRRRGRGLNNYTSVNERSFLRGLAADLEWHKLSFTPFVSCKSIDASVQCDTVTGREWISSLPDNGYHRTPTEIEHRHQVEERLAGANLRYKHHLFAVESGYSRWQISLPLRPDGHLKNEYRFSGDKMERLWLAPSLFLGRLNLFGEVVLQNYKEWGFYQGLTYSPGSDMVLSLAYRKYSRGYSPLYAQAFSESSNPGGESGFFASFEFRPWAKWTLKAYADLFAYDWLRYDVFAPSSGFEWFAQADYDISRKQKMYFRYKSSDKTTNSDGDGTAYGLASYGKQNLRFYYKATLSEHWSVQAQVEQSFYRAEASSRGWMAFQDVSWRASKCKVSLRYAIFDIDDYNSRIYAYEPDVLYAFTIPAYQYQGGRLIANGNFDWHKNWRLWLRVSHTCYKNRETISSGYQEIDGNQLTEFKVQLQYRFTHWDE